MMMLEVREAAAQKSLPAAAPKHWKVPVVALLVGPLTELMKKRV